MKPYLHDNFLNIDSLEKGWNEEMVNLGKRASVETNVVKKKEEEKSSGKRARWEKSEGGSGITILEKSGENESSRKFSKTLSEITGKQLDEKQRE